MLSDEDPEQYRLADSLIAEIEDPFVSRWRFRYNLPPNADEALDITDVEIRVDERRWLYYQHLLNPDGSPRERDEFGRFYDEDDLNNPYLHRDVDMTGLPDTPEYELEEGGFQEIISHPEKFTNTKGGQDFLRRVADKHLNEKIREAIG